MEIHAVKEPDLHENTYVLIEQDECLIIDPGSSDENVLQEIYSLISNKRLRGIIYTHNHYDHVRGGRFFNTKQYMDEIDIELLPLMSEKARVIYGIELEEPTNLIPLQKELILGLFNLKTFNTPGHTKGSVCILINANKKEESVLFTGDTLFKGTYGRTDVGGNPIEMKESLTFLSKLDPNLKFYPGHGAPSMIGDELYWLNSLEERGLFNESDKYV